MVDCKQRFLDAMDAAGIRYTDVGPGQVRIVYKGNNLPVISILAAFDADGTVQFRCGCNCRFLDSNWRGGMTRCNEANRKQRWVRFYLDDDWNVVCAMDALAHTAGSGARCVWLLKKMVRVVDDGYALISRTVCYF